MAGPGGFIYHPLACQKHVLHPLIKVIPKSHITVAKNDMAAALLESKGFWLGVVLRYRINIKYGMFLFFSVIFYNRKSDGCNILYAFL